MRLLNKIEYFNKPCHFYKINSLSEYQYKILLYSFIILGIFSGISCHNITKDDNVLMHYKKSQLVMKLWEQEAAKQNLDENIIQNVRNLFYQAANNNVQIQSSDTEVGDQADVKRLRESLERFISQFKPCFIDAEKQSGTSYWTAYLFIQYVKRNHSTIDDIEQTQIWFDGFKQNVLTAIDENIKNTLNQEDFLKYKEQIEQIHVWTSKTLDYCFNEFSQDPLFPIFKEPLSSRQEEGVFKFIREDGTFRTNMKNPKKMMVLEEEHVVEQMEKSYKTVPQNTIFQTVIVTHWYEWAKSEYWGGMSCYVTTGLTKTGIWPVEVSLRQNNVN